VTIGSDPTMVSRLASSHLNQRRTGPNPWGV
jgi:hypothetical protein